MMQTDLGEKASQEETEKRASLSPVNSAWLTVDLGAVLRNYIFLSEFVSSSSSAEGGAVCECAAVLKADAYGLGLEQIAGVLAGRVRSFFVAHPQEGQVLRHILDNHGQKGARIFVLHGFFPGDAVSLLSDRLIPVLNSLEQVREWNDLAGRRTQKEGRLQAALQFDTGMSRFGLSEEDIEAVKRAYAGLDCEIVLVMSHLACADILSAKENEAQYKQFMRMSGYFPGVPRSLAASSGIFLDPAYHFEMVRSGAALYGIAPNQGLAEQNSPLSPVVTLQARIQQIRTVPKGAWVGYGATWQAERSSILATIGIGYADGLLRSLAGKGACCWYQGQSLPVIGRLSMDSLSVDMTDLQGKRPQVGEAVILLGGQDEGGTSLDRLAGEAGTIGYEILTSLGRRYARFYKDV